MPTGLTAGVAVDSEHVYWPDNANGSIGRADIDGSNPDPSWIPNVFDPSDGAYDNLRGLYVDYGHVWWAHDYHCDYVPQPPGPCGGGSIGRANIDGSGADDMFIPSEALAGPGCGTDPETRCGPTAVALTPQTEAVCLNVATAPPAPTGGAVFHRAGATGRTPWCSRRGRAGRATRPAAAPARRRSWRRRRRSRSRPGPRCR